jgi:hypothetical protein
MQKSRMIRLLLFLAFQSEIIFLLLNTLHAVLHAVGIRLYVLAFE